MPLAAQDASTLRNDLPQPYRTTPDWGALPPSVAQWPAVTALETLPDGTIYVVERCHGNTCEGRSEPPILKYSASGTLLQPWGKGLLNFPHGAAVDAEGNLWVTAARGGNGKGHQAIEFAPDGRVLMTLGTAGVSGSGPSLFDQPTDSVVAPSGDLFVTDSHRNGTNNRVVHFSKDGRFIRECGTRKLGPIFTPPPVSRLEGPLAGFRSSGGTNWPGGSFDPETHVAYVPSYKSFPTVALMRPPSREFSDVDWVQGFADRGVVYVTGPGEDVGADALPRNERTAAAPRSTGAPAAAPTTTTGEAAQSLNPLGLPVLKPPYGQLTAIDMDTGEFLWQTPHGETPDAVRNHPALAGLTIARTGQGAAVGALVTRTLVIAGDPQATVTPQHPRGAMLRAYDKRTGREVGAVYMAAPQSGTPMTYAVNRRQHIVVAISGGAYSGEYVAFRLPR